MNKNQQKIKSILFLVVLLLFFTALCLLVGRPMLNFVSQPQKFRDWVQSRGVLAHIIFVLMVAFQVFFAIIPGEPLEIVAGYAFGAVEGTILCVIGGLLGSLAVFYLVRTFGKRFVELFFSVEKLNNLKFLKDTKKLNKLTFLIFLIPGTPKDLFVYFLGLTKIELSAFVITASIGRLPSIITSTIGGDALGVKNYVFAIITFGVAIVLGAAGFWLYNFIINKLKK